MITKMKLAKFYYLGNYSIKLWKPKEVEYCENIFKFSFFSWCLKLVPGENEKSQNNVSILKQILI